MAKATSGRPKSKTRKTSSDATGRHAETEPDPRQMLCDAALRLAARMDWDRVSYGDILAEAGIGTGRVYLFRNRESVVAACMRGIDGELSLSAGMEQDDSFHDRLFDLLMQRLDLLEPHRRAIANMHASYRRRPWSALCLLPQMEASMTALLKKAGSEIPTPLRKPQGAVLAAGWIGFILPAWIADENPDLSRTMAALDRFLTRAEPLLQPRPALVRRESAKAA